MGIDLGEMVMRYDVLDVDSLRAVELHRYMH